MHRSIGRPRSGGDIVNMTASFRLVRAISTVSARPYLIRRRCGQRSGNRRVVGRLTSICA